MTSRKLPTANQIAARLHDYGTSQLHADADERLRLMDAESKTAAAEKKRLDMIISTQHAEIERLREQFDPDKFAHSPDCCGATIDTRCMGCTMAEQTARAEEVATLRYDRNRLRAALVGIVGDDDPASMTTTRAVLAAINMAGSGDAIAAIDALMDIRP